MNFDAGALLFKIQTVGAQVFQKEQRDAEQAIQRTGDAAKSAKPKIDGLGTATDDAAKKSKTAKQPLTEQAKATEEVGKQSEQASKKQNKQKQSTEEQAAAAKSLSVAMLAAGAATAAMVTLSVVKYAEFDQGMSNVRAATMATADEQRALGEAALDAGADTAYSASEAAAAEEELAKAGVSVTEIIGGGLTGALTLAAAGQLQVARSAEIMATTLKQYKLPAEDAAHVSDLLAAGSGKAQGSVEDLANALKFVGPVAAGLGISLEETTGILALFAEQGIIGEQAGTSLRGVLSSLTSPSALAARTMKAYNVEIFDGNGKMKSGAAVAQELQTAFYGLSDAERSAAMGRIFGNEQITAATMLMQGGAKAVEDWTEKVNDSGYAAEQAAMRQDNLAGDIEKLGGAFDTALIRTGTSANDVLRMMVQGVTELVDIYGEAPEPIQATALVLGVAAGAMLLLAGSAVGARVKFLELKAQMDAANVSMGKTALAGAVAGLALTGVVTVVGLLMAAQQRARQRAESYADALEQGGDAARNLAADNLTAEKSFLWISRGSAADAAKTLGVSLDTVADAATGNAEALEKVNAAIEKGLAENWKPAKDANGELAEAAVVLKETIDEETAAYEAGTSALAAKNEMTEESSSTSQTAAESYLEEAGAVDDLNSQLAELIDQINEANGVNQDAITSSIDYQNTLRDVDEQIANIKNGVEGYAHGIDEATQAGADNKAMLVEQAQQAWDYAEAQMAAGGSTEEFTGRLEAARQELYDNAIQMGATEEEAALLRDTILSMPTQQEIKILANTAFAQQEIESYISKNTGREIILKIGTSNVAQGPGGGGGITQADGGVVSYFANGGVRENHVAQIARAGDYRVWAEPETGGEGYVPLAVSKRARSEAIMTEIAGRFGGTYIPGGAQQYAQGAVSAPAAASSGPARIELSANGELFKFIDVKVAEPTDNLGFELGGY